MSTPISPEALAFACNAIAEKFDLEYEDVTQEFDENDPPAFILCEVNREDGEHYFTGHKTPRDAVYYSNEQEYAEDWRAVGLFDVNSDTWYVGSVSVKIEHVEDFKAP